MIIRIYRFFKFLFKSIPKMWRLTEWESIIISFIGFRTKEKKLYFKSRIKDLLEEMSKEFGMSTIEIKNEPKKEQIN